MLKFTLVKGKIVLDQNIVLFNELSDLYDIPRGENLLRVIYYMHSRDEDNPFRDISQRVLEENVLQITLAVGTWKEVNLTKKEKTLFSAAEKHYIAYTTTPESRLEKSMDRKIDELSKLMDDTEPVIKITYPKSGEVKFNSNLSIILNLFTKVESLMKSKNVLRGAILKQENTGKVRGGGTTSFREMGSLKKN